MKSLLWSEGYSGFRRSKRKVQMSTCGVRIGGCGEWVGILRMTSAVLITGFSRSEEYLEKEHSAHCLDEEILEW